MPNTDVDRRWPVVPLTLYLRILGVLGASSLVKIHGHKLPVVALKVIVGQLSSVFWNSIPSSPSAPVLAVFRKVYDIASKLLSPHIPVALVKDMHMFVHGSSQGVIVRLYYPTEPFHALPCIMWYHGGGFTLGSIDAYDHICCQLARQTQCVVASVEYRMGPEHSFPTAHEDCYAATKWIWAQRVSLGLSPTKPFAVAGDSAGGNIAITVPLQANLEPTTCDDALRIVSVVPIYPTVSAIGLFPSKREFFNGFPLGMPAIYWFILQYCPLRWQQLDWRMALIEADRSLLKCLPRTHLIVAEEDPLRDEILMFNDLLASLEVPVNMKRFHMKHGDFGHRFGMGMPSLQWAAMKLREDLHGPAARL